MLLALFVPLATAGAEHQEFTGQIAEGAGTVDAVPESATNLVPETGTTVPPNTHTIDVTVEPDDTDPDNEDVTIIAQLDDPPGNASYDGGLPDGTSETADCTEGDTGDDCQVALSGVIVESGKDRIRVFRDANGNGTWDEDEDFDFVTKTWVGPGDEAATARLGGEDRIETAVEISRDHWADAGDATDERQQAEHVVIARASDFPDALAGTPLAVQVEGPLLLTFREVLEDETEAELQRVLATDDDDDTDVYILGQQDAISLDVEAEIDDLGYDTERLGGEDRFETAVEIGNEIKSLQGDTLRHIFLARSHVFPDSLAGGAAAAQVGETPPTEVMEDRDEEGVEGTVGAILLTPDGDKRGVTEDFLGENADATTYALAGPIYNEYACEPQAEGEPEWTTERCDEADVGSADFNIYGWDRHETARAIGEFFFDGPAQVGIARSDLFPDALTGGAHIGQLNGPIVLTPPSALHHDPERYLCYTADTIAGAFIYGETDAIHASTADEVDAAIDGTDCVDYDTPGIEVDPGA